MYVYTRHSYYFFDPDTQFRWKEKIMLRSTKKYKNQAGMNITPPLLHKTVTQQDGIVLALIVCKRHAY